ncbi:hypothetical protein [Candidatus Chlorohelix sp.]|uniref:hypothetical protein n=1 Tax=Candidatus Chlorohelix sp. TaxID=3139201 RepID=UPI0030654D89
MDLTRNYRDDDSLKKGEAQLYQLQQQVDEVRRIVREQMARQHSVEDNWKQSELRVIQIREQMDRFVAEVTQATQVRNLDEQRIKQELAELQFRSGEPAKAVRDLRSQFADIVETRRKENEQLGLDRLQLDKLLMTVRDGQSQITRLDGAIRDLREAVKITANAQEFYQRELDRVLDIIHNNEQSVRRIAEEFNQQVVDLRAEVQLFANRITRLEDLQRLDTARIDEVAPVLDVLRQEDERVMSNVVRVERLFNERILLNQGRLEEIRQQLESQFFSLNQVIVGNNESTQTRFVTLDERLRTLDKGIVELQVRIEQVKQVEDSEVFELYQLEEMRVARQLEAIQAEFDLVRQHRSRSQAGGLAGRRAAKARAKAQAQEQPEPETDDSI